MFKRLFVLIMLLLFSSALVFADYGYDDQGNPNDPNENDRANACYEGGSMEGKCETIWEWECGWYLIQFEYGLLERGEFPTWCAMVIPPEILPEELVVIVDSGSTPSIPVCVPRATNSLLYTGVPNVVPNIEFHIGPDCVNFSYAYPHLLIIQADTEAEALAICEALYPPPGTTLFSEGTFSLGAGYWGCTTT